MLPASGWRGLKSATHSSGTIADGTSSRTDRFDASQPDPTMTLARPAGIDAQVAGSLFGGSEDL
jgi:hypothetical protein